MTDVLKLGGSVITEKSRPETVDDARLHRMVDAIAERGGDDLILVHGGGSFGHPAANRHGVSRTTGTRDVAAVYDIADAMRRLNERVIDALHDRSVPAVGIQAMAMASRGIEGDVTCSTHGLGQLRDEGFLPVLNGDVIAHAGVGCSVVSGDELAVAVGAALGAERIGFCSDVPGVLDAEGDVIERIDADEQLAIDLGDADVTDVTGGMAAKVQGLAACEIPAAIFGVADLPAFLAGRMPGTTIG